MGHARAVYQRGNHTVANDALNAERETHAIARAAAPVRRALTILAGRFLLNQGWQPLGFARLHDYATERLGISARTLHELAEVDRALCELPQLDAAYVRGELSWTKLRLIARVARPDNQAVWLARASRTTATALAREARAVDVGSLHAPGALDQPAASMDDDLTDEPPQNFRVRCTTQLLGKWHRTRQLANRVAGRTLPPWECVEMVTAEVLSAVPLEEPVDASPVAGAARRMGAPAKAPGPPPEEPPPAHRLHRSAQTNTDRPVPSSSGDAAAAGPGLIMSRLCALVANLLDLDAFAVDARLRQVVRLEQQLDAELGAQLALVAREGLHRLAGFATFDTYARERLGVAPRKARALLRLDRACRRWPAFARAYREGTLSWVQAHALIPVLMLNRGGDHGRAWIEWGTQVSVRRLRDDIERALVLSETAPEHFAVTGGLPNGADDGPLGGDGGTPPERQIGARPTVSREDTELFVHGPADIVRLVRAAVCTVRRAIERQTGYQPTEGEAFDFMLEHALATWGDNAPVRAAHRVFARDGWRCTVPGCSSQQNLHDHHIVFRSAGGSNDLSNRTTLCAWHHLRGVHAGTVRCTGTAPGVLRFDLGLRRGRRPLLSFAPGEQLSPRGCRI